MQDNVFIGFDVHKATISVAVAQGERGGETCKRNGVDPYRYLTWYCRKKAEAGDAFDPRRHFPWEFKAHPDYATFNPNELPRSTMLKSQRLSSDPPRVAA